MAVLVVAFAVHLVIEGGRTIKQKAKGELTMSQSQCCRLIKLWQGEIARLVCVSRAAYDQSGGEALSEAHVQSIARLQTARAVEASLRKAIYRRTGHAGSLFSPIRIPHTELVYAYPPGDKNMPEGLQHDSRRQAYDILASFEYNRPAHYRSHSAYESLPLYEPNKLPDYNPASTLATVHEG